MACNRLLLVFAAFFLSGTIATAAELNSRQTRYIIDKANSLIAQPTVTGITVAVGRQGQIVFAEGFGFANIETGEMVTPSTKMRAGSVSKVMTTALLARMMELGRLDLDAPIQIYVPSFPEKRWPLTIRDMSAHMGGVRHYAGDEFLNTHHYTSVLDGLKMFRNSPLVFRPGTQVSYSSHAWNLISAALEKPAGTDFLSAMTEHVFAPLGMTETMAEDVTEPLPNLAGFHVQDGGRTVIAPFVDNSYKWAGGGFVSTARDLVRFGLAHTKPGFLEQETLELLFKEQHTLTGAPAGFGIGWMTANNMRRRLARRGSNSLNDAVDDKLVWHSGGSMGAAALLLVDPSSETAVGLMVNHSEGYRSIQELGLNILRVIKKTNGTETNPETSP